VTLGDTLAQAPAARAARDALEGRDDAWIVGGAIRDAGLGGAVKDVDIAVGSDERDAARAIAKAAGGVAFELSEEFGTWRALSADRAWHVDATRLRGPDIEADLALRDFTVNAIAVPLADPGAQPLDPHGGLEDLDRRLVRAVSERSFADDPLRILRAARLASALDFGLEADTVKLAKAEASRAGEPAGARQLAELRMLISGPDPIRGLELLDELAATASILPELEALRGVVQNPNHHLDVHGHTLEVLRNLLDIERDLERYAGEVAGGVAELLAEPLADGFQRGDALRLGAVLHDIGKPATRQEHEGGFVSFIGHDREGAKLVAGVCQRWSASRSLSRHLEALTLHHLHLGFMAPERPLPRERLYEYLRQTEPVATDVTLLTVADRLSARGTGPTAAPEMIEAHLELAREVLPHALEWHRAGPPRPPIAGDELASAVGIEEGPTLGRLLEEVRKGVFTGEVKSADDAVAVARAALASDEGSD
jgi:poly(A) polymerase